MIIDNIETLDFNFATRANPNLLPSFSVTNGNINIGSVVDITKN
jgi:hypothetical protein